MLKFIINPEPSGLIRGYQIAKYLNCPVVAAKEFVPSIGETCIFVKQAFNENWPERSYLDLVDSYSHRYEVVKRDDIRTIVFTEECLQYMTMIIDRKRIIYIPQHHCNFDRAVRSEDREVKTIGFVGGVAALSGIDIEKFTKEITEAGFNFILKWCSGKFRLYPTREEVVEFYKGIDIQISYRAINNRPGFSYFKDSLKIKNASSFCIPTVAFPEQDATLHFPDCFIPVKSPSDLIKECKRLRDDKELYRDISNKGLAKAENFHISKIAPMYLELEK
jgi:hypothetical protein